MFKIFLALISASYFCGVASAKTVSYTLTATQGSVNLSGKKTVDFALMINGGIPAPTLEFNDGDDAEILVKNEIPNQEVSIHWHGILLPPEMDGVPYVTTPPIHSGASHLFKFRLRQSGTYWYHSHTNVQEQKGIYGAFVIHPKKAVIKADHDVVAILSDWSDENPTQILKNLRKDGDYYLYKKKTMRSYLGAIKARALPVFFNNEWTRMGGMDLSDVGYDAFLINGKKDLQLLDARRGQKVRLRIINAGASSYFNISLGNEVMRVVSADGLDIKPIGAKEILIGMAETYDVLFTVPDHKNYELKVTAQDGTGSASGWIGMGEKVFAPVKPFPDLYMSMNHMSGMDHGAMGSSMMGSMDHSSMNMTGMAGMNHENANTPAKAVPKPTVVMPEMGHGSMDHSSMDMTDMAGMNHENANPPPKDESKAKAAMAMDHGSMNHATMDHSAHSGHVTIAPKKAATDFLSVVSTLTVDELSSPEITEFKNPEKIHDVKLELGGDMVRYIWYINGKAIFQDRNIVIKENEIVRFTFVNKTMMHHPMHLHGHFFRVINKNGSYSPLKHTVDVPPHMTRVIEFKANEPGEWMLHCHNLYHLKTGMARVVKYEAFEPSDAIKHFQHQDPHHHDHWYTHTMLEAASNHAELNYHLSQTWNEIEARVETRNSESRNFSFKEPWEVEGDLLYHRRFGRFFALEGGGTVFARNTRAVIGASYVLPWLINSQFLLDHKGKVRFDFEKRFQWTRTIFTDGNFTWRPGQRSNISRPFEYEVSLMYSPVWAWAGGLMLTERTIGAGVHFQF